MDKRFVIFLLACFLLMVGNLFVASLFDDPPTDIILKTAEVDAGSPVETVVGQLTAKDPDGGRHRFDLDDNAEGRFKIAKRDLGFDLVVAREDLLPDTEHKITVKVTDQRGREMSKSFVITVVKPAIKPTVEDPPVVPPNEPVVRREDPQPEIEPVAPGSIPQQWVALGSAQRENDPTKKPAYDMLVILTNQGAAIEQIELNSPNYLHLEDRQWRRGYLGYLALTDAEGGGAQVRVVGRGTPAEKAGLRAPVYYKKGELNDQGELSKVGEVKTPGDVIVAIQFSGGAKLAVKGALDFEARMRDAGVGQEITLTVRREKEGDKEEITLDPTALGKRPLDVIHPERQSRLAPFDPLSMLLTLQSVRRKATKEEWSIEKTLGAATAASEGDGALLIEVDPGGPADQAGLQRGDIITEIDGTEITAPMDVDQKLLEAPAGARLAVKFQRLGQPHTEIVSLPEEIDGVDLRRGNWRIVKQTESEVEFRRHVDVLNLDVIKRFRLANSLSEKGGPAYHLTMEIEIINTGDQASEIAYQLDGPTGLPVEGWWYGMKIGRDWGSVGERDIAYQYQDEAPQLVGCLRIVNDGVLPEEVAPSDPQKPTPLRYVGVDARYFSAALKPLRSEGDPGEIWFRHLRPIRVGLLPLEKKRAKTANTSFRLVSIEHELQPSEAIKKNFLLYVGPKRPELLASPIYQLSELVYYGWFSWVAQLMVGLLHFFHGIAPNYGLAIIMLTVMVRACMFPLSKKQVLNAQKMQELQPVIRQINEKHKNAPEKRMAETRELFKKNNYNPFGGCLVLFVQLPIFIGLYRGLAVDVELRQTPLFEGLGWCSNLAAPDMLYYWEKIMPAFLASDIGWLGPYFNLLPVITIALFLVQQKMFTPPPADDQAAMQMKMMKYMMIFFLFMFFCVPSGLCIYFIASSSWGIAERKLLPKLTGVKATAANTAEPETSAAAVRKQRAADRSAGNGSATRSKKKRKKKGKK